MFLLNKYFLKNLGKRNQIKKISLVALILILIMGCSTNEPDSVEKKYDLAIQYMDKGNFSQASPLLQEVIDENPGTRYATYAYLKLGDSLTDSGESKYNEAETNYRIFLNFSQNSHLVPYVLSRLMELNYKRNVSRLFDEDYAFSRDPDHFQKIINEYQRFYLLFPDSLYLADARQYYDKSVEALAEHEFLIGNWYMEHSLYRPSIARYLYILKVYPNYPNWEKVVEKLIIAYEKNQQPRLANELARVYQIKLNEKK